MTKFTENQLRAIKTPGNIIVSAGAGSGKTTVMIARIVDKLLRGARLDEMLIVTFTRASAADMRVKLAKELNSLIDSGGKSARVLETAVESMPVCNIGTLHSYCQKLMKNYFYAAQADPSATVCEEGEAAVLKRECAKAAISSAKQRDDKDFLAVYDMLAGRRNDNGVVAVVTDIMEYALSTAHPERYLDVSATDGERLAELNGIFSQKADALAKRIEKLKLDLDAAGMNKQSAALDDFMPYACGAADKIRSTAHKATGDMRDILNDEFKSLKDDCKKLRRFADDIATARTVDSLPYTRALCETARDALRRYAERKAKLGKIDYSDLEHGAFRVLSDEKCMAEISRSVKYVFIDEFQDVNPLQSEIARKFKDGGAEMFLVGDVKQSIYGFRRCSPEHFRKTLSDPDYTAIALVENFRSRPAVIDFINNVFDGVLTVDFGGADYSNRERLVCGNTAQTDGGAEYCLVSVPDTKPEIPDPTECAAYSVEKHAAANGAVELDEEAVCVADRIVDMLACDDGQKTELGSIAVLVRSTRGKFCKSLGEELDKRGIAYNIGRKASVKDYPEAVALIDIMRCVDNRFDDVALYTAMRSPMGGFSDGELAEIATEGESIARKSGVTPVYGTDRKSYTFWQKVRAYDGSLSARITEFYRLRDRMVKYAKTHDSADLLGFITSNIDYFQYVYETGGDARVVESLIDNAATRKCDMHAFLSYLDSADFQPEIECGGDAVTITTVHSSKGLEYDYVIVADTARKFNTGDSVARAIVGERGVALKVADPQTRMLIKSVPWLIENALSPDSLREEELRLFYVALTRAKRRLTVCGKDKNKTSVAPTAARCPLDFMQNVSPARFTSPKREIGKTDEDRFLPVADGIVNEVRARCEMKYDLSSTPIKTCVTALSHCAEDEFDYTAAAPVLTNDEDINGENSDGNALSRRRGTAYHRAMELVDFGAPDMDELKKSCEDFDLVDSDDILRAAKVMNELVRDAAFVGRERYFIVDLTAAAHSGSTDGESVLVQGVIDLLIVDKDGNATIVDYKTGDPRRIADNAGYAEQLRLYAAAVEKATPFKVVRKYLYPFVSGQLIEK